MTWLGVLITAEPVTKASQIVLKTNDALYDLLLSESLGRGLLPFVNQPTRMEINGVEWTRGVHPTKRIEVDGWSIVLYEE